MLTVVFVVRRRMQLENDHDPVPLRKLGGAVSDYPGRAGANEKSFPRGAPLQHLAPRRNPERSNGHVTALD